MKILFITANRVGDAVLTTGLLRFLTQEYPDALFTIACGPHGADLFRAVPGLEKLIVMRKKRFDGHWLDLWKEVASTRWDIVIDLRNSIVSRLIFAKKRFFHKGSSGRHKVIDNGAVMHLDPAPPPFIWVSEVAQNQADALLPADKPLLALGPAANWAGKQWPIEYFIELVKHLTAPGEAFAYGAVMVLADGHEREQIAPLLEAIPSGRLIEVIGLDLQIAAACLKRARLYVGNDSGLMHLAAALGTPTLGLFGPGFPHIYGPWGKHGAYVTTPESRDELLARPFDPNQSSLMGSLDVQRVLDAAHILLDRTG